MTYLFVIPGGGYNTGYGEPSGWDNQSPWESNNSQESWDNQDYEDQNWSQDNFGDGYQQGFSGGPMRSNYNSQRQQPYNTGNLQV